LEKYVKVVLLK